MNAGRRLTVLAGLLIAVWVWSQAYPALAGRLLQEATAKDRTAPREELSNLPGARPTALLIRTTSPIVKFTPNPTRQPVTPSATSTPTPLRRPTNPPPISTATPTRVLAVTLPACTPSASFVGDVTIPDGTEVTSGSAFRKVWRVENTGSCSWGPNVSLVFERGDLRNPMVIGREFNGQDAPPTPTRTSPLGREALILPLESPQAGNRVFELDRTSGTVVFGEGQFGLIPSPGTNV
jgi:hypothetical protein